MAAEYYQGASGEDLEQICSCPYCDSYETQLIKDAQAGGPRRLVGLRCCNCNETFQMEVHVEDFRAMKNRDELAKAALRGVYEETLATNMTEEAEIWAGALQLDLIMADDFKQSLNGKIMP